MNPQACAGYMALRPHLRHQHMAIFDWLLGQTSAQPPGTDWTANEIGHAMLGSSPGVRDVWKRLREMVRLELVVTKPKRQCTSVPSTKEVTAWSLAETPPTKERLWALYRDLHENIPSRRRDQAVLRSIKKLRDVRTSLLNDNYNANIIAKISGVISDLDTSK